MKILAGATLLGVAPKASAQKSNHSPLPTSPFLQVRIVASRRIFCAVSISLVTLTEKTCTSSIARQKAGRNSCQVLRPTSFG